MSTWHFVDAQTGIPVGRTYSGPESALATNTPAGCVAVRGRPEVRPPPPAAHEHYGWTWNDEQGRWLPEPTLAGRKAARVALLVGEIEAVEATQARALREALAAAVAGQAVPAAAAQRMAEVEARIVQLRARIAAVQAADTDDGVEQA